MRRGITVNHIILAVKFSGKCCYRLDLPLGYRKVFRQPVLCVRLLRYLLKVVRAVDQVIAVFICRQQNARLRNVKCTVLQYRGLACLIPCPGIAGAKRKAKFLVESLRGKFFL